MLNSRANSRSSRTARSGRSANRPNSSTAAHKDWFLHDRNGKPIASWNGKYTLDYTVPAVHEHIRKITRTASREWGYEFFKFDGMAQKNMEAPTVRACAKDPKSRDWFVESVKSMRAGVGDDRHLTQGAVELKDERWDAAARRLDVTLTVVGGFPLALAVSVPEGFAVKGVTAPDGVKVETHPSEGLLRVTVTAPKTADIAVSVRL